MFVPAPGIPQVHPIGKEILQILTMENRTPSLAASVAERGVACGEKSRTF